MGIPDPLESIRGSMTPVRDFLEGIGRSRLVNRFSMTTTPVSLTLVRGPMTAFGASMMGIQRSRRFILRTGDSFPGIGSQSRLQ